MASDVVVPEVGETGMDVTFVRWLKAAGDDVAVGDPLFEVDTDKSVMIVEAYAAGTLVDLAAGEGDIVAPRDVIGRIVGKDESIAPAGLEAQPAPSPDTPPPGGSIEIVASSAISATGPGDAVAAAATNVEAAGPADQPRSRVSPRARRVAKKLGVETNGLSGSGPDGLITESDIRAVAEAAGKKPPAQAADPAERARKAIAELTTSSWQTIPHFYLQLEADVDRALELAKPTSLILAATAQALVQHPECNLAWEGETPIRRDSVDLGLLVDTPHGLLITVIDGAHDLDLDDMSGAIAAAVERARNGKLSAADLRPRSLTVSNLGMYSVDRFTAVIPKPDVLTLAVGRVQVRPRWDGSAFSPKRLIDLTLSVDHRALDGAAAARFLTGLETVLRDPESEGLA